ncbi:apolipoprotein C-IV [Acipenser oxyrinchus oxyrinchus]|uniref:Apolipoprotein C-IV n=1 Tax=Acipenser oxyrinchus oxyrinchus TaxID=40147 RepID=A0AAD8CHZ9_ACIOX|nr:apolipoprotein C-IV [Acipenser oxyrinchus oxyrinchus]KAK1155131.1 apolipoprotein C-IV [Acipenser oxyrinchus oxyrinchus]
MGCRTLAVTIVLVCALRVYLSEGAPADVQSGEAEQAGLLDRYRSWFDSLEFTAPLSGFAQAYYEDHIGPVTLPLMKWVSDKVDYAWSFVF